MTRIIIISCLVAVYILFGCPDWLASDETAYLLKVFLYSFYHASWWHLAVNCLAIWTVFSPKKSNIRNFFTAYIISILVYPIALRPVVGISNLLYAILGMKTPPFSSVWWKNPGVILFLAITVAMLFFPQFSATTHIAAFVLGILVAHLRRFINRMSNDTGRFIR